MPEDIATDEYGNAISVYCFSNNHYGCDGRVMLSIAKQKGPYVIAQVVDCECECHKKEKVNVSNSNA